MGLAKNILAIYADQDKAVVLPILADLKALEKNSELQLWSDNPIYQNQPWKLKEVSRIELADVFVLFLSNAFMYSEFIQQIEFKNIIDKYKTEQAKVIPILLDDCPWDTEFNSEDYDFSFKELLVLPEANKPISDWASKDEALKLTSEKLKQIILPQSKKTVKEKSVEKTTKEKEVAEEQIAINFSSEKNVSDTNEVKPNQKKDHSEQKIADEEIKRKEVEEAKKQALQDIKVKEEGEARRKAREAKKMQEKADKKALEDKKKQEALEAQQKAMQTEMLEEARKLEKLQQEKNETKEKRADVAAVNRSEEPQSEGNEKLKNRALIGIALALLACAVWFFWDGTSSSKKQETNVNEVEMAPTEEAEIIVEPEQVREKVETASSSSKLAIGDNFESGIIFSLDASGNSGKMATYDDEGPMTWTDAMKIDEKLGDGWRLPTLEELELMRNTIGQGADNKGEFSDGLYWSATPFDDYQARLMRFRDGNTTYHYNSTGTHRKYRMRPIKDFSR